MNGKQTWVLPVFLQVCAGGLLLRVIAWYPAWVRA